MIDVVLTTVDNPYDPFTQPDAWLQYDIEKGYNTNAYLNRVIERQNLDDPTIEQISEVIDEIILRDPANFYRKVSKKS